MSEDVYEIPMSGGVPYAIGQSTVVRIPVPGTRGLCLEFRPRGHRPATGSTSTLFFQDAVGKKHLRLDYGFNPRTNTIDYHWNHKSTHAVHGIENHTPAGRVGKIAYHAAKYFRYAGRAVMVVGVGVDIVPIALADRPLRRASEVVAAWAAAWAGCKLVGAGGAAVGLAASPVGSAVGGVAGCIIGGVGGYWAGSSVAGAVFDWAEGTIFSPLPELRQP